jgi:hypothetical protein
MRISILSVTAASLCLLSLTSGCLYEIRDEFIECEMCITNHCRASGAWHECKPVYKSMDHHSDFKKGFMEGYQAAASGGNGCPPALPPPCYWKVKYQSDKGKAQTNAWFDGYSHGALAAEADGVAEINRIVTRGRIADVGHHDDGHQIVLPTDGHGMPSDMTPSNVVPNDFLPPAPVESSPSL